MNKIEIRLGEDSLQGKRGGGMNLINVFYVAIATVIIAVPVLRFQDGLAKGMRTAEAGRYALFMR